ncbi:MAG: MBL fold metallo-hydrolase [Kiritimatiellae bacterium]|nr:MBL fold metallo-hydrolase [Kiritimatiellia bacterium]
MIKIAKTCCRTLAVTLCVTVVLPSVAFDWKAKPVAELKADLVSYARKVGENNLADRVEKSVGAAEWMDLAIGRGTELLKASEGCDSHDKRREHGLRIIDYPLHFDNYSTDASLEDIRAFNAVVYAYCASARDRVFAEVVNAKIPEGQLRLWRIYNMGFIIKGPRHTVAIDVTNLPLFRDKPDRRCAPNKDFIIWKPKDWRRLVELTDMFVLTHPHGDHYCGKGIAAYLAAGKPVVLPCGLDNLKMPDGVSGAGQNCIVQAHDNPEPIDINGVKLWNFMGHQGKKVPCNVYLMEIDGVRVAHNGDNSDIDKEKMLAKCPPADVIIASTWNRVRAMVGACAAAPGFDRSKAVLIPSHENEITHGVSNRESYWEMYERKDRLGGKSFPWPQVRPLGYGESIVVGCRRGP